MRQSVKRRMGMRGHLYRGLVVMVTLVLSFSLVLPDYPSLAEAQRRGGGGGGRSRSSASRGGSARSGSTNRSTQSRSSSRTRSARKDLETATNRVVRGSRFMRRQARSMRLRTPCRAAQGSGVKGR